ncbi:MAG TPA: response regulator, partial [Ramlibacter sp.]|nr:response regulator [Ramlibacter sp.]
DEAVTVQEVHTVPTLLDQALLALHHNLARLPEPKRELINSVYESSKPLSGKRVLIVDDDMRNIFALATVLEEHGMDIVWADNGREAINRVANDSNIQVVLMDIMMPEMDGMATMKEIRKLPQGKNLPMIAVTAKAMKGDREKCIEAGAWDYLSKPVNTQDLLTVLRAWLHH